MSPVLRSLLLGAAVEGWGLANGASQGSRPTSVEWFLQKAGNRGPRYIACCSQGEPAQGSAGAQPGGCLPSLLGKVGIPPGEERALVQAHFPSQLGEDASASHVFYTPPWYSANPSGSPFLFSRVTKSTLATPTFGKSESIPTHARMPCAH